MHRETQRFGAAMSDALSEPPAARLRAKPRPAKSPAAKTTGPKPAAKSTGPKRAAKTTGSKPAAKAAGSQASQAKAKASPGAAQRQAGAKPAAAPRGEKPARRRAGDAERITGILDTLDQLYPDAHCELNFRSPFELLVAVILSAQCTDDRVNLVTPELFRRYPDPKALAESDPAEVERIIYSTGFFRNKAKNIRLAAHKIVEKFGGAVPRTMDELLSLPGVARKTANVVLGTAYAIPSGVVVDTHVTRLAQRLGLTRHSDAVKIEQDLAARWPRERWIMGAHRLIWHGRRVCNARKPSCDQCALAPLCPSVELS